MTTQEQHSVGLVSPRLFSYEQPFALQNGDVLPGFNLMYETYGELSERGDNAVLICHALSGHHHAAGYYEGDQKPGWWDHCIGPGKAMDTNKLFIVSLNNLGGCHGSTGPESNNPETGQAYGPDFPQVVVKDWVASQALLADHLNIDCFLAVVGGSLGGMQALQWSIDFPHRLKNAVLIATAAKLTAQNIAFNEIARQAITSDPEYRSGHYRTKDTNPDHGLMLARMIGHVTYLSDDGMANRFGRELKSGDIDKVLDVEFQVESYLHHQGRSFTQRFDANTYLLMTRALDYFDPARETGGELVTALERTQARFLIMSFTTDWRFSPERSKEIVDALIAAGKDVASTVIESEHGHDSFLLPIARYTDALRAYLDRAYATSAQQQSH
ncbi:MAG: homoserine O-acetyltransferase [Pseudomonadota bacterium]|nr:homoserine O-acetyltransferase [Pseudomonadota bacterium]MEC7955664.1 homoserine O-acetyltransferase [Pseudomonadota bacterium]MEC7969808.1 homoserine O-acetyltransferase [Pseudomonadota bacterium]MEC8349065.1 homoserine O-acetyltransferase [Pseudomonadota bacterium]MEE2823240.1 homoserine O-acetyltransferase [Pseudomonadota bacterium]|tara:strand:+ start:992 stop:2146 length:1155 start_codon:yes stop_codon:yes gene_type:complete